MKKIVVCLLLVSGVVYARWIDPREVPVMLEVLTRAGAQTFLGTEHETIVLGQQVDCLESTAPPAAAVTQCNFVDGSDGKDLSVDDSGSRLLFTLTAHYGGEFTQWEQGDVNYRRVRARWIKCTKAEGHNHPWEGRVSDD
jgi:hypothetical protein